jgi:hypothetical protein
VRQKKQYLDCLYVRQKKQYLDCLYVRQKKQYLDCLVVVLDYTNIKYLFVEIMDPRIHLMVIYNCYYYYDTNAWGGGVRENARSK